MTTQERINQLANAALHAGPPVASIPKPATFTPALEKLKETPVAVEIPNVIATQAPVLELVETPASEASSEISQHQTDPVLGALLEENERRMKKKLFRQKMYANLIILGLMTSTGVWYSTSPRAQAEVAALIPALRQSVKDVKNVGGILGEYDKSLKKIATHSTQIEDATRSMGIDPTSVSEKDDLNMDKEMSEFTRGEGKTTTQRNKMLQEKLGFVGRLAGDKGKLGQEKPEQQKP